MNNIDLAKQAICEVEGVSFKLSVTSSSDSLYADEWKKSQYFTLSRNQILYLLREKSSHKELFDGHKTEEVNVQTEINKVIEEATIEGKNPVANVNNIIPEELSDLAERLEVLDEDDTRESARIREELKQIKGGEYTFYFTIETDGYYIEDNAEMTISLTAEEAIGLLYGYYGYDDLFDGICIRAYDEDFINEKAKGFAEKYNEAKLCSDCPELETFLEAWMYILDGILDGRITEETLTKWLQYFEDSTNYNFPIEELINC